MPDCRRTRCPMLRPRRRSFKGELGGEIMRRLLFVLPVVALGLASGAFAQTTGGIEGKVTDAQGLVLPGVSVTLTGEAVLGAQTAVTLADGTYRFRALRPASYNLAFELAGFLLYLYNSWSVDLFW